ncbi:MAG: hypothetical protein Kow0019_11800 [Methanobacteriaceae archaeon]
MLNTAGLHKHFIFELTKIKRKLGFNRTELNSPNLKKTRPKKLKIRDKLRSKEKTDNYYIMK